MSSRSGPNRSATNRGFAVYDEFEDLNGFRVRLQESSLATEPAVWIFAGVSGPRPGTAPHLGVEAARRLRDALDAFLAERGP